MWSVREILGARAGKGHFTIFVDNIVFLVLGQSGCLGLSVRITPQGVSVCKRKFAVILRICMFVVLA